MFLTSIYDNDMLFKAALLYHVLWLVWWKYYVFWIWYHGNSMFLALPAVKFMSYSLGQCCLCIRVVSLSFFLLSLFCISLLIHFWQFPRVLGCGAVWFPDVRFQNRWVHYLILSLLLYSTMAFTPWRKTCFYFHQTHTISGRLLFHSYQWAVTFPSWACWGM